MVRAKFKINSKEETIDGVTIKAWPVTNGSEENQEFFRWTPSGKIELGTVNKAVADQFQIGKEYYVDFTPADESSSC